MFMVSVIHIHTCKSKCDKVSFYSPVEWIEQYRTLPTRLRDAQTERRNYIPDVGDVSPCHSPSHGHLEGMRFNPYESITLIPHS